MSDVYYTVRKICKVAKDNPWANSVESKQRALPACQWFGNTYVQNFTFISAKKLPKMREDHREIVKVSRHCGCQYQGCNGYWEWDLGKEVRLCRINEEQHPMEDQWAKLAWSSCHQCQKTCPGVGVLWQGYCQWLWIRFLQLLALTAGLVSQLNFSTCSCLPPSLLLSTGISLGCGLSPPALSLLSAHLLFQGKVLFIIPFSSESVFSWLQTYWGNAYQRQILGWIWKYRSWKHQQILQFLLLSHIAAQLAGLSCLLFSFLSGTAIIKLFIESAALGHLQ